jgi:hypothetical protein
VGDWNAALNRRVQVLGDKGRCCTPSGRIRAWPVGRCLGRIRKSYLPADEKELLLASIAASRVFNFWTLEEQKNIQLAFALQG